MGKKKDKENGEVNSELQEAEGYLPGTAPIVVKEIVDCVLDIENVLKPKFGKARDALVAKQDRLSELSHEHIEHFSEPDENHARFYRVPVTSGIVVVKIVLEKETITTKIEKPKNPTV